MFRPAVAIIRLFRSKQLRLFYTGRFIMFSVITNIYNKKTKGPTLIELFTATGKLKKFFLFFFYLFIFSLFFIIFFFFI